MIGLTEIKLRHIDHNKVCSISSNDGFKFEACNATKTGGGGLLLIWNEEAFTLNFVVIGERRIIVNGQVNSYS